MAFQLIHPAVFRSFSTVLLHVVFGLPFAHFPSGCHPSAVLQSSFPSLLRMCPFKFHLLLRTSQLIFSMPDISNILTLVILFCHLILNILLEHLIWNVSIHFSSLFVIFYVSQSYNNTGLTKVLNRCIVVFLYITPVFHTLASLWNVPLPFCNLFLISLTPPPSLSTLAPKYANPLTSPTGSLLTLMVSSLVYSVLSILHLLAFKSNPSLSALFCWSYHLNLGTWMTTRTRQIIRYRATATLRRPKICTISSVCKVEVLQ